MTAIWIALAVALALLIGASNVLVRRRRRLRLPAEAVISDPPADSAAEHSSGAVRSVQAADIFLPTAALEQIWTPMHLERLARTYWRFISRVTLGLIRVCYSEHERFVVLIARPLKLFTFQAPEYEMDAMHGLVRWRIARGLLVARRGRGQGGYLQIAVRRYPAEPEAQRGRLHVEVEVANFYPAIAFGISRRIYNATQSHLHVLVTHGFLRSLARLDLAESRVGRLAPDAAVDARR